MRESHCSHPSELFLLREEEEEEEEEGVFLWFMVYGLFSSVLSFPSEVLHHEEEERRHCLFHSPSTECHSVVRSRPRRDTLLSARLTGYVEAGEAGPLAPRQLYFPPFCRQGNLKRGTLNERETDVPAQDVPGSSSGVGDPGGGVKYELGAQEISWPTLLAASPLIGEEVNESRRRRRREARGAGGRGEYLPGVTARPALLPSV